MPFNPIDTVNDFLVVYTVPTPRPIGPEPKPAEYVEPGYGPTNKGATPQNGKKGANSRATQKSPKYAVPDNGNGYDASKDKALAGGIIDPWRFVADSYDDDCGMMPAEQWAHDFMMLLFERAVHYNEADWGWALASDHEFYFCNAASFFCHEDGLALKGAASSQAELLRMEIDKRLAALDAREAHAREIVGRVMAKREADARFQLQMKLMLAAHTTDSKPKEDTLIKELQDTRLVMAQALQSPSEVIEQAATERFPVRPEKITEIVEGVRYAYEHPSILEARTLPDGFFIEDRAGEWVLMHPALERGLIVAEMNVMGGPAFYEPPRSEIRGRLITIKDINAQKRQAQKASRINKMLLVHDTPTVEFDALHTELGQARWAKHRRDIEASTYHWAGGWGRKVEAREAKAAPVTALLPAKLAA